MAEEYEGVLSILGCLILWLIFPFCLLWRIAHPRGMAQVVKGQDGFVEGSTSSSDGDKKEGRKKGIVCPS